MHGVPSTCAERRAALTSALPMGQPGRREPRQAFLPEPEAAGEVLGDDLKGGEGLGGEPGCFPLLGEPHRTVWSACARRAGEAGGRQHCSLSCRNWLHNVFHPFCSCHPFLVLGMNRNDALRSLAPGCVDCPQMATVGSGQGVQNSMRERFT